MMKKQYYLVVFAAILLASCAKSERVEPMPETGDASMYFPSSRSANWEEMSPDELGWDISKLSDLQNYLADKNSKAFIVLVNGRIVIEDYFNGHDAESVWEWNSAGKTLVSAVTGIAQQEGRCSIDDAVSEYLGAGWTNMPEAKEDMITIKHLLSMTSGIDDTKQLVVRSNLNYMADAGTRWAYGNVFQKLIDVSTACTGQYFEDYFNSKIKYKIGMDGYWNYGAIYTIYYSTARSMARFGLLALNGGAWKDETVIDSAFFEESIHSSQQINPSYGYFWWLNGKSHYMVPNEQTIYDGYLVPHAPADMYAAMGAYDQRIYVVPSRNMVIVRMGEAAYPESPNFAVSGFDDELWQKINAVIQ